LVAGAKDRLDDNQPPPHDFLSIAGGSIGFSIPVAVGAAIACPDRRVITYVPDGSGLDTLQGPRTQARENLDVLTVVLANRAYAILLAELRNLGVNEVGRNASRMTSLTVGPRLRRIFGIFAPARWAAACARRQEDRAPSTSRASSSD
jgi:hypothetical protein